MGMNVSQEHLEILRREDIRSVEAADLVHYVFISACLLLIRVSRHTTDRENLPSSLTFLREGRPYSPEVR